MTGSLHLWLIPLIPFAGFLVNGLIGRKFPRVLVSAVALIATLIPFIHVATIWFQFKSISIPYVENVGTWIWTGDFHADFSLQLDQLTMVMLLIVTGVGFIIHVYSVGYMAHEEGYWRFFAYLNLFMFFMLVLVLSDNFLLMFVGWEGVGLASYLLIGFYFLKDSAAKAGKKAFVVNRIGDFGFLLAMFLIIAHFGTLNFGEVFTRITNNPDWQGGVLTVIALCLVLGATGKSAQIPLYVWLPDAMEGPTPVSALIHAATMVTAGVYMVARTHVLFDRSPVALSTVAFIGAITSFFAATIGLVQTDIKRVLAYSTVSQLGYMFLACGVAAYSSGIFHLVTHAFFKALLFLSAGSVIHALGGQQDMRVMGGLRKKIPVTFWTMTAGVFAICGFPPFAGFFSKDEILYQAFISPNGGKILWFIGWVTAGLTSFYMFRLWYLTFLGESRAESPEVAEPGAAVHARSDSKLVLEAEPAHSHGVHESPWVMLAPLVILATLATIGGFLGVPAAMGGHDEIGHFLDPLLGSGTHAGGESSGLELGMSALSVLIGLVGLLAVHILYKVKPELPHKLATQLHGLYSLLLNKYWVDELYGAIIVTPLLLISRYVLKALIDTGVIDGGGFAAGATAQGFGAIVQRVQSGNIRSYAGWLAAGAALLLIAAYFGFAHF
jgi:NADH-quinone oxidoreductase subunit L